MFYHIFMNCSHTSHKTLRRKAIVEMWKNWELYNKHFKYICLSCEKVFASRKHWLDEVCPKCKNEDPELYYKCEDSKRNKISIAQLRRSRYKI